MLAQTIKEDMSLGQSISGTGETSFLSTKERESMLATPPCYKLAFRN